MLTPICNLRDPNNLTLRSVPQGRVSKGGIRTLFVADPFETALRASSG